NADNVLDIIMMIADPDKYQTPDQEPRAIIEAATATPPARSASQLATSQAPAGEPVATEVPDKSRILAEFGYNPLNIPHEHVDYDLKTDSWAQLHMPAIDARMQYLHSQLQQPLNVDDTLRAIFPFAHFVLTTSGQSAENIFFKAWPRKGIIPQNL